MSKPTPIEKKRGVRRGCVVNGLLALASFLVVCMGVEGYLRLFSPQATFSRAKARTAAYHRESEWLPFELSPNHVGEYKSWENPEGYTVKTNVLGFRGEPFEVAKPEGTYRVMTVGDSFTFGFSVDNNDTYSAFLEDCLNSISSSPTLYEVINAGYASGFSPDSYYVFLRELAGPYQPDLVIVGFYVGNDFIDLDETKWVGEEEGLPVRVVSSTRHVNAFGQFVFGPEQPFPLRYRVPILRELHTFQFVVDRVNAIRLRARTNTAPGSLEVADESDEDESHSLDRMNYFHADWDARHQALFDRAMHMVEAMQELAEERNYQLLVVLFPEGFQTSADWWGVVLQRPYPAPEDAYPQKPMRTYLQAHDIDYVDLLPALWGGGEDYYFVPNGHWTVKGNRQVSEVLCQYLQAHYLDGGAAAENP